MEGTHHYQTLGCLISWRYVLLISVHKAFGINNIINITHIDAVNGVNWWRPVKILCCTKKQNIPKVKHNAQKGKASVCEKHVIILSTTIKAFVFVFNSWFIFLRAFMCNFGMCRALKFYDLCSSFTESHLNLIFLQNHYFFSRVQLG